MKIIKRNNEVVEFNKTKIKDAIMKAMTYGSGIVEEKIAEDIANEIENIFVKSGKTPTIYKVEDLVYTKLIDKGQEWTAKYYEGYRAVQSFKRQVNLID